MLIYYLWDKQLVKNIPYGSKPRNYLDIYLPRNFDKKDKKKKYPVFVFFTGTESLYLHLYLLYIA
jgi:hypothetical protein